MQKTVFVTVETIVVGIQFIVQFTHQLLSDQPEGAVDVKASRIATLIIIAAIAICVAGVLILPQVDLPDFVLNGSKAHTITAVHGKPTSSSNSFSHVGILNPILSADRIINPAQQLETPAHLLDRTRSSLFAVSPFPSTYSP